MYKVVRDLTVKVKGVVKTYLPGTVVNLPEAAAKMFIGQGKIAQIFAPVDDMGERMAIQGENCAPEEVRPYVTDYDSLVIPWNSDPRYHYWKKGGQSPCQTLKELGRCDLIPKYQSPYSDN